MKNVILLFFFISIVSIKVQSQSQQICNSTLQWHEEKMQNYPDYKQHVEKYQRLVKQIISDPLLKDPNCTAGPVIIPIAVHFENGIVPVGQESCAIDIVNEQIDELIAEINGLDTDAGLFSNFTTCFGTTVGNACLDFCLATKDHPAGYGLANGDPAITFGTVDFSIISPGVSDVPIDANWAGYLNIFVGNLSGGLLGQSAGIPGGFSGEGVVVDACHFGIEGGTVCPGMNTTSTCSFMPYDEGEVLVHEIGHYLGLFHIWGDVNGGGCAGDDNIADTPDMSSNYSAYEDCTAHSVCSDLPETCGSEDMYMNFMSYASNACVYMFTSDQADVMSAVAIAAGFSTATTSVCLPALKYVDKSATGANDGSTWNDAFNYLQDAIDDSTSGDTIWVAAGTYYPDEGMNQTDNDRNASFIMKNGVVIFGGFDGTEPFDFDVKQRDILNNETILSGDIDQVVDYFGNSYHILYNTNVDNTAVLDGFSITEGAANLSSLNPNGGGMYNDSSSPLIQNCNFYWNGAVSGGAMYNDNSSPLIQSCNFSKNTGDSGGAIYNINNSNTTILNCSFLTNYAFVNGGAISIAVGSYLSIKYSSFAGNYASANGPAIRIFSTSNLDISHSILWGNGFGTGGTNIDLLSSGASIPCDYCIIDTDGGGNHPGIGTINQNPLFVDPAPTNLNYIGGDLRLQVGSPAIDFIVDPTGPMTDQDGKMRPIGIGHDIGAYESDCPTAHNLTGTINPFFQSYDTDGTVESDQIILAPADVIYNSGTSIELKSGFEIKQGATLQAIIEGCITPQ